MAGNNRLKKFLLIVVMSIVPISLGAIMSFYLIKAANLTKKQLETVKTNITNTNGNWNASNISFINDNINYSGQVSDSDFSNLFKTKIINDTKYINNVISAAQLGDMNFMDNYSNMNSIQLVNVSNTIDNIARNYKNRYKKSSKNESAWFNKQINMSNYYLNDKTGNQTLINNSFNNFSLEKPTTSLLEAYDLSLIPQNLSLTMPYVNGAYTIIKQDYWQRTNYEDNKGFKAKEIVVKSTNYRNELFIDDSTVDYWIDFLLRPENLDVNRIIVEPANLIIYRRNDYAKIFDVPLNIKSGTNLFSNSYLTNSITINDWANSCINQNPTNKDFDFRETFKYDIQNINSLTIPKIITINDQQYLKTGKYSEADQIAPYILYAKKPNGTHDRNWGITPFSNLSKLFVSANAYAPNVSSNNIFNIGYVNSETNVNSYTNAIANTGFITANMPIFSNQYFVVPNLANFATTNIKSYFNTYDYLNNLIVYKSYNDNYSDASFARMKDLYISFMPELYNRNSSYNFCLNNALISPGANLPIIGPNSVDFYINKYLSNLKNTRDINNTTYNDFEFVQNQWATTKIINVNQPSYLFGFSYTYSKYYNDLVIPFSLISNIEKMANPFKLGDQYMSRIVDYSSSTIAYNKYIAIGNLSPYPINLLTNDSFESFILNKARQGNSNIIDIAFQDWVDNKWMGLSNDLDIIAVLRANGITVNNFFVPNIKVLNQNDLIKISYKLFNKDMVISLSLMTVAIILIFIQLFIIICIVKTPGKYNWAYLQARDEFGY